MELIFDFQKAIQQASRLEELSATLKHEADSGLDSSLEEISAAWKGSAATAYLNKAQRLQSRIVSSASDLETTAAVIRRISQCLYQAEQEAIRRATERTY